MCSLAFSQNGRIPLTPSATKSGSLQSNSMSGFSTTFSFNSIESQSISNEKGTFSEIYIDGSFPYGEVGSPSLPMITRLIAIPEGATPVVTVNGYSENEYVLQDYDINTLSAQQAPVRKNIDPTTVEYVVNNAAYASDVYTTDEIASVEYLGTMRGIRIGKLTVRPVSYNAVANTIKVRNDINVSVDFENANAALTQSIFASTYSPAFNSIYDQLLNKSIFGSNTRSAYTDHPDLYNTPVRMLVICYSGFRDNASLNQWLAWKLQKGYYVDIFYTDETGTTANSIKSFIQTKYNASVSAGNAYTYLIVIGDTDQVPQYMTKNIDSSIGNCASDLGYAAINFSTSSTTNYFPDMFYSRISVENATHLSNYVEKVITYEKYQMSDGGNYLNNVILVGGWDSSWTSTVARPTINYGSNYYFNSSNTTFGGFENGNIEATVSTSSTAGYAGSATGTSTTMGNGVYTSINTGVGFLNYTAHGDKQEWYQPKLTAAQVANLTNAGKYFFGVGNCCLTGNFNNTTTTYSPGSTIGTNACFAETMIRVPKAGAVAYVGCSPYSYWYEDFYWAVGAHSFSSGTAPTTSASTMGVYDAMFVDDYWNSASSLLYLGNLAVQQAVSSNNTNSSITSGNCNNSAHYYFQFYHTFGDGSVMPYVTKPEANTVTIPASVMSGATSMTVNAVAGSYVAVTDNESTIYGVAVANASGVATVNFTNAIPGSGTLYVVVTRQQYQPYFGTVSVIAPNPPVADFTGAPTTIIERESVTFTNNSQYAATYLWNFGDGETSTEMNPVHTYMTPGTYTVTLRVENTLGNDTKTRTNYITVNPNTNPPAADFVASETEISVGTSITFTDLTENIPTSWEWTFEGGTPATSTEQNPSVTYDEPGEYTVTLVAHNAYGSDTEAKTAYITVFYPDVVMSNDPVYVCAGTYKDPGGDDNYENNLSYTQTIYPSTEGAYVRLTFTEFSLENASYNRCYDKFYIYDGTSTSATALINGVCGTSNPGTVTATNDAGALTIKFTSDQSEVSTGWVAEISCYIPGPEVAVQSYTPTTARYSTTNDLNITFTNTGVGTTSENTTATISTTDEYITLNNSSAILGSIARNATTDGTFNFTMAEDVPDGHVVTINVAITDGSNSWNETITITAIGHSCDAPTGLQVAVNNSDATITWDAQTISTVTISDDFEGHTYGTINSAGTVGWTYIDGDNTATATFSTIDFTNEGANMAYIVIDGSQVTGSSVATAHSGNNYIGSPYISSTTQNDDWIVSPELNFTEDFNFSFYARSFSSRYSTEKFYAAYSTTGNSAGDFINLNNPATTTTATWTEYSYTVPANAKYVAIHCVSSDMFMFCVDDITISGNGLSGAASVNIYDNGVLVASNISTGTYTATNLSVGEHCFSIRAVCDDDSESLAAQQCVTIENNLPRYNVTVNSNNGGTVTPNGTQTVYEGSSFSFTATPNECYEIGSVTVNGSAVALTNNSYTINNITADQTVNITFNQISYTIVASAGNGGTITPAGNTTVNCGENQTFAITANNGYRILDVTVDGQSVGVVESYTFENVVANHSISATFIAVLNIEINADAEGGSVSPTGTQTLDAGESFTFTVTPDNCYEIGTVTVNGNSVVLDANNSYTIENVTTNQNINVTFNQITYTIVASAGNGGTITPNGNVNVNCGEGQTFAIAANNGYRILDVTVDGQSVGAIESYTFENVVANHSISATFIAVLNIEINADAEGGSVSPTGTQTLDAGESFTFSVTPEPCYEIGTVTVNGNTVVLDANNSYTIENVTTNQNINVTFNQITYTITASAENGGTITPSGVVNVNCGESKAFTISANEGYMISDVLVDGQSVGTQSSYTFTNVDANHTISVTFAEIPDNHIVITVNADAEGGSVSPSGTQSIEQGEDFTFTVTPNACYAIGTVTVNGTAVTLDANNSYTIENVTTEQTVNVTFDMITYIITASAGNGGTITPAGDVEVNCGESMTFAIAASEGYQIVDVVVDGVSAGAVESYTFSNVTANGHSIVASFELIPANEFEIIINADAEGGSVSPTGTQTVTEGDDFTFTVTPDACYTIGTVTVNGAPVELDANNSYTIANVTAEQTINVTFNQIVYTIAASAGNGGIITPAGDVEVNCGANATFTITPDDGYEIADVIVDGQSAINDIASYATIGASASYTFNNVTANGHSIIATFSLIPVEVCNTITNLEVSVEPYGNLISWTAAENAVSYNIFRNDETTPIANIPSTQYVDMNGRENDSYYIVTICTYGESDPSESVVAIPTAIDETSISVEIYPNPASDKFMIECEGMTTIEIFNVVGQSMGMIDVNSDSISVESSAWTSGVYSVRITTENAGTIVKQIIKQ